MKVFEDMAPSFMARSYLPDAGSGFAADRRTAFRLRDILHLVLSMRAILNIGLQHRSFTSLSSNGPTSGKASDPDFDCAWGEKMRISTEEVARPKGVGSVTGCGGLASGPTNQEFLA
jgi:hypothetical protein